MPSNLTAIIIDDEALAIKTLEILLSEYCPNVTILGSYGTVPQGVLEINKQNPDLVFLDIEMPEYNGFELLNFFKEINFEIIFVTAYNQYALKAFEVSAVDYVLKPIDEELLIKAVEKATKRIGTHQMQESLELLKTNTESHIFRRIALPVAEGLLFIEIEDIAYLEAERAYTNVYLKNKKHLLVSKRLKYFEDLLSNWKIFYRCHRSFLVNLNCVKMLNRNESYLMLDDEKNIPISREKKSDFEELLQRFNLLIKV